MKKLVCLSILALFSYGLTACKSSQNTDSSTPKQTENSSTVDSSNQTENVKTVFTGVIQENAESSDTDSVQVFLKEVKPVEDQEDIVKSFKSDGVILNIPQEVLTVSKEELTKGKTLKVTLQGIPVMTMSIPPQLPGRTIEQIELVE